MSNAEKPDEFVTKADKKLIQMTFVIAVACTLAIFNPVTGFNAALIRAIPLQVSLLFFLIPVIIYLSIHTMEKNFSFQLALKDSHKKAIRKKTQKILFTCRYRERGDHTIWKLTNRSQFCWTNTKFFIEKSLDGNITTEKHDLGNMPEMTRTILESKMLPDDGAKWRAMVLTEEGHLVEYPDRQPGLDFEDQ